MTVTTESASTRRSILRSAVVAGSAVVVAPIALPLVAATSAEAAPARARAKVGCQPAKLRKKVKGRKATVCKPQSKAAKSGQKSGSTGTSASGSGTSSTRGTSTTPTLPNASVKSQSPKAPATPRPVTPAPVPIPLPAGSMLSASDRHLVSRFSYGVDRPLANQALAAGGGAAWFEAQLTAPGTADPATDVLTDWWPSLRRTPQDLWARNQNGAEYGWNVMQDYQRYVLVRRLRSTRPVLDVMAEFWENHFNVPVMGDGVYTYRAAYGAAIREKALGTFEELLATAVLHPAMLIYLNAAVSTKAKPNENLGRELLELHTVGRGNYGEDDVKASARILTGYKVALWSTWVASYQPSDHWTGSLRVINTTYPNTAADGRATTATYLRDLARHPATAQRIVRKLAVKFVSDTPSQALVDQLAQVYLDNGTAIAPVLRALVASSEFAAATGAKVRDPAEEVVATYKALGVDIAPPTSARSGNSAEMAILWQTATLGQTPHSWPQPDGAPTTNAAWSSSSRLLSSLELHFAMAGGWWPTQGTTYRSIPQWLPSASVSFVDLVEHLSREILHTSTPPGLLTAAGQAVGTAPSAVITVDHPVVRWKFARLLATVLDHPMHFKR